MSARVLVVEPDDGVRNETVKFLILNGLEAHEAVTGVQAVECVRKQSPDVVLLALALPEGCGRFVIMQLEAMASPPAVVVISVKPDPELPPNRVVRKVICKPANPAAVLMAVFEAAGK